MAGEIIKCSKCGDFIQNEFSLFSNEKNGCPECEVNYCKVCGEEIQQNHTACYKHFCDVGKSIKLCSFCGKLHHQAFPCFCESVMIQCDECGVWHSNKEACPCKTSMKTDVLICAATTESPATANECEEQIKDITRLSKIEIDYRRKYEANIRCVDGHYVRSQGEARIDDFLCSEDIVHCYENIIAPNEKGFCDFYIPKYKCFIEFWGMKDKLYLSRKEEKLEIYKKYNLRLIEIEPEHLNNLSDYLLCEFDKLKKCNK
ncbi:MAG: hypothetical protein FWD49_01840 [Firmicutes bacterium]|nr:hypothetical protein [Bacillota bacterium]